MSNKMKLVEKMASNLGVDPKAFYDSLKKTAFKLPKGQEATDEQMMALLVIADQYGLNPYTKEIYAYPANGGITPVVGVDGWIRIINEHPSYDGMEFNYSNNMVHPEGANTTCYEWIECVIHRRDKRNPIVVREYLDETYKAPFRQGLLTPWQTHPKRMLRHKVIIQCARVAFGFSGIYDPDEAQNIKDMGNADVVNHPQQPQQDVIGQPSQSHPEMDEFLAKLANRAMERNAWAACYEYLTERYGHSNSQHKYAVAYIRKQEELFLQQQQQPEQEVQQPEQEVQQHQQQEQV